MEWRLDGRWMAGRASLRPGLGLLLGLGLGLMSPPGAQAAPGVGLALLHGEVLASGCSIALEDQYQTVSLGALPLRVLDTGEGHRAQAFRIRFDQCQPPGQGVRIRFEGVQGAQPAWFQPGGSGRGIALVLRDGSRALLYPGAYSATQPERGHDRQVLHFTVEAVPDGQVPQAGDYHAALRFQVNYE